MKATSVSDGIYRLSANGGREILFESMWPLPNGVAMNSYVVRGKETAIIDGVCGWDGVPQTLFRQLEEMNIGLKDIRYVILNHLEPDHTGWLEPFLQLHDDFQLIASAKGLELVRSFYGYEKNLRAVADGDSLDLGDGKELLFPHFDGQLLRQPNPVPLRPVRFLRKRGTGGGLRRSAG